jgi:glycosyltransferase involved in cell wall biosynthesis
LTEFDDRVLGNRLAKIGRSPEKLIIGTTAAVDVRYKGQQYVIEALGHLKNEGITNIEYQLVGNGDQTYLREIAEKFDVSEQVKFIGGLPHDEVFKWLETIDGYVQPSKQEGLPRALIEAMSRAVPAFGANTAGIPELLDEEFIFSNGKNEVDEICAIIQKLYKVEILKNQSLRNYDESKKYDRTVIEGRRNKFINEFVAFSKNGILEKT